MTEVCTELSKFIWEGVMPLTAYTSVILAAIIGVSYAVGNALSNPKLTLWSKTEAVQMVISIASVVVLLGFMNLFCTIQVGELATIFSKPLPGAGNDMDLYAAADTYLVNAQTYAYKALSAIRYHLEAYSVLSSFNEFQCDFPIGRFALGCLFGNSGQGFPPFGGYGALMGALNVFFNTALMTLFTVMNFSMILSATLGGLVFIFIPFGIFMRSMPFMRTFGSLLISLAISFMVVYPLMLSVLYLMSDTLLDAKNGFTPLSSVYNENNFPQYEGNALGQSMMGEDYTKAQYFYGGNEENPVGAIVFAAYAFVSAVFLPSVAMLATLATIGYTTRLLGEEIDLSRIMQLV